VSRWVFVGLGERSEGATAQTFWESMEAVERFAVATPDVAVVEPAAAALVSPDSFVEHFGVPANTL